MATWNEDIVRSLITDISALRDGEKLAQTRSIWSSLGGDTRAVWGLAQGSGKSPYQVCVDLNDTNAKCSCPSRKFPCKHAVGLMLLLARDGIAGGQERPTWVSNWLEGRERRREAAPAPTKPQDAAAQAKREAARHAKVAAGIEELRLFLEDLVRRGLSDPVVKTYAFWDRIAARMVDAQMQPVARRLRAMGGAPFQKKANWTSLLMEEVARLYMLTEAFGRLDTLSELLVHDVRTALGFSLKQEEVLETGTPIKDQWQILGVLTDNIDQLQERRTWLYGESTGRYALILDYAHRSRSFDTHYPIGRAFSGELVYYPSAYPQRALVKERQGNYSKIPANAVQFEQSIDAILNTYADALASNPFLQVLPTGVQHGWLTRSELIDTTGLKLPLKRGAQTTWLNAVTGGNWHPIFGEWDGAVFQITSLVTADEWTQLEGV